MQGCRGRSPPAKLTFNLPLPAGKGGGGMGQAGKEKAGLAGEKKDMPSAGYLLRGVSPCRFRLRCGDARGEAPCIRKQKISPFPGGEGGWGDRGQKGRERLGGRRQISQAPLRLPERQGRQATKKASPPANTAAARSAGDQNRLAPRRGTPLPPVCK